MVESLREREVLYKLIISQLRYDGLDMVAANLAKCVGLETTPLSPSSRLLGLMKLGLQEEKNGIVPDMETPPGLVPPIPPARGLDLEYETEGSATVRQENRTLDSNSLYTGICNKEVFLNLKESIVSERTSEDLGISAETTNTGKIDTAVDDVNVDVEIDLNAQPTLIACKDDVGTDHRTMGGRCIFELVRSSSHIIPEDKTTDILASDIESKGEVPKKTEETADLILSSIVDFNPKNKGKLTDKNRHSAEYISRAFKPYREQLRFENFKDLVSAEVMSFGINQSIFSKAVLKRSQGYLSDLLNRQEAIMSMEEPSRMFTNFMKIKSFLDLDEAERRVRYYECVKEAEAEQNQNDKYSLSKVNRRKKRMSFSKGVKDSLKALFKDRMSMPDVDELTEISEKFGLELATVKNFFRNFKARSKISETL